MLPGSFAQLSSKGRQFDTLGLGTPGLSLYGLAAGPPGSALGMRLDYAMGIQEGLSFGSPAAGSSASPGLAVG